MMSRNEPFHPMRYLRTGTTAYADLTNERQIQPVLAPKQCISATLSALGNKRMQSGLQELHGHYQGTIVPIRKLGASRGDVMCGRWHRTYLTYSVNPACYTISLSSYVAKVVAVAFRSSGRFASPPPRRCRTPDGELEHVSCPLTFLSAN